MSKSSIARVAGRGMVFIGTAAMVAKLAALGSQFVLGWLLAAEDFALYAICISAAGLVLALQNGGTEKILVQKASQYDELAPLVVQVAMLFNVIGLALLFCLSPVLAGFHQAQDIQYLLWIIAISLPLGTLSMVFKAKLSADLRFADLSKVSISSAVARHGSMIIFALLGFGPLSFVLPLLVVVLIETIIGYIMVGRLPAWQRLDKQSFTNIFNDSKWIMAGAMATALVMHGDYLVVGFFVEKPVLGIYFFGVQLTVAVSALLTYGIRTVMMPAFSSLNADPDKQRTAYLKSMSGMSLIMGAVGIGLALLSDPLISCLWSGKWDAAIPVVQLISLSLVIRLMTPLSRSVLEAKGQWRFITFLLLLDAAGTAIFAYIGLMLGGPAVIAAFVSLYRVLFGIVYTLYISRYLQIQSKEIINIFALTFIHSISALVMAGLLMLPFYNRIEEIWFYPVCCLLFFIFYVVFAWLFRKQDVKALIKIFYSSKKTQVSV